MASKSKKISKKAPKFTNLPLLILVIVLISMVGALFLQSASTKKAVQSKLPEPKLNQLSTDKKSNPPSKPKVVVVEAASKVEQPEGSQLRVPVLMYHYIGNNPDPSDQKRYYLSVTPDNFDKQMQYLQSNGYTTITLDTIYAALKKQVSLPSRCVVLTFDDGYVDFYFNAYPILKKYNFHATVFIPTGLANQGYYLSWAQIKEMQSSGLVHFGAHTVHHYNLPSFSESTILSELIESKKTLQDNLGVPINFMAYPNGASNAMVEEFAKKAGYLGAVGTWASQWQSEGTIYNLPRMRVGGGVTLEYFAKLL